jgi:hypothetical protein
MYIYVHTGEEKNGQGRTCVKCHVVDQKSHMSDLRRRIRAQYIDKNVQLTGG